MGKLAIVILIGAAGYGGWACIGKKQSEAFQGYEKYSDALLEDRHNDAANLAVGESAIAVVESEKVMHAHFGSSRVVVGQVSRTIVSEVASSDGKQVTLTVNVDCRRGSGLAPVGPPTVRYKQVAVMVQTEAGWRVDSFQQESESLVKAE
ncbi:MAG: hypothetical protein AAB434_02585 [Planctomycetota bacterium]